MFNQNQISPIPDRRRRKQAPLLSEEELNAITYPDMDGMEMMLIVPDDFYRKKLFGVGMAYVATALHRCRVNVSVMDCAIFHFDDIEIARMLVQTKARVFGIGALYPMFLQVESMYSRTRAPLSMMRGYSAALAGLPLRLWGWGS